MNKYEENVMNEINGISQSQWNAIASFLFISLSQCSTILFLLQSILLSLERTKVYTNGSRTIEQIPANQQRSWSAQEECA